MTAKKANVVRLSNLCVVASAESISHALFINAILVAAQAILPTNKSVHLTIWCMYVHEFVESRWTVDTIPVPSFVT
jgi:hypothetical protein